MVAVGPHPRPFSQGEKGRHTICVKTSFSFRALLQHVGGAIYRRNDSLQTVLRIN